MKEDDKGKGKANEDKANEDKANEDKANEDKETKTIEEKAKEEKAKEEKAKEEKAKEEKAKEEKAKEEKAKEEKAKEKAKEDEKRERKDREEKEKKDREEKERKEENQKKEIERKREAAKIEEQKQAICAIPLDYGVVLYKSVLSHSQQLDIVKECLAMNDNLSKQASSIKPTTLFQSNWFGDGKRTVSSVSTLLDYGRNLFAKLPGSPDGNGNAHALNTEDQCVRFEPDAVSALLYARGSSLTQHRDSKPGWVLGLSVGSAARFYFSGDKSKKTEVQLESGDVIVYNGTRLLHGVEGIVPDTAPAYWKREVSGENCPAIGFERFVLSFRDSTHVEPR